MVKLTEIERTIVLGLAGREPFRSQMISLSRTDVTACASAINNLIVTGRLGRDAYPKGLAIAEAEEWGMDETERIRR